MSEVYRARIEGDGGFTRDIALKCLMPLAGDGEVTRLLLSEASVAARLSHPNIIQVFDLRCIDGVYCIAMEYLDGPDLAQLIRRILSTGGSLPPPAVVAFIGREVAQALAHAHEGGRRGADRRPIVHRDISPDNVLIGFDGQIKLIDFGLARVMDPLPQGHGPEPLRGKLGYMAPEVLETGVCNPKSDIYATGVLLHELLTGRRLFQGRSQSEIADKIRLMAVPPPSAMNPNVSTELDRIVMTAMEKDCARRYQHAAHLARDLDVCLQELRFFEGDLVAWLHAVVPTTERNMHWGWPQDLTLRVPEVERPTVHSKAAPDALETLIVLPPAIRQRRTPRLIAALMLTILAGLGLGMVWSLQRGTPPVGALVDPPAVSPAPPSSAPEPLPSSVSECTPSLLQPPPMKGSGSGRTHARRPPARRSSDADDVDLSSIR